MKLSPTVTQGSEIPSDSEKSLDERPKRVLDKSFAARLGVMCAGVALMCDGYFNNVMSPVNLVFKLRYPKDYTNIISTRVSNALLVGEVIGMIVIGLSCDALGRKSAMVLTTLCMVVGGILATAAHGTTTTGMFWMIVVMRGVIGFGSAGEYPTSSSTAAESANESMEKRGRAFILVTNLPLALGGPFCYIVFLIVWVAAGGPHHLSTIWRVCFGIGCIWPAFIFYFRWKTMKSKMFSNSRFMNWNVPWLLIFKYYWKPLVGTCGAWFVYDWVSFGSSIWSGLIIQSVADHSDIKKIAEWQLLVGVIAIPGVIVGAFTCDWIGRKWTLVIGFAGYLIFGLILGCAYDQIRHIVPLFVVFYGIFNSFGNMGPGDMMGLLSTELYATPVRGTLYGLSAAVGKAGGAVGTQVFHPIQKNLGTKWVFIIAALIGVAGIIITIVFIPNRNDDDLAAEDDRFYAYLRAHGWDGQRGDDSSSSNEFDEQEKTGVSEVFDSAESSANSSKSLDSKNKKRVSVTVKSF